MKKKELLACGAGIVVGGILMYVGQIVTSPAADSYDTLYHVHADFKVFIGNDSLDLSKDEYMTTAKQELSDHVHLHDGNGDVEHIHLAGVTFSEFLNTIGLTLTNNCLSQNDIEYCNNGTGNLKLFVNNKPYLNSIESYIPSDEDRILVYYGNAGDTEMQSFLDSVTEDSCFYSGTCPERGIAPPESCGLTCEL